VLKSATIKYLLAIFSYFKKVGKDDTLEEIKRIVNPIRFVGEADLVRNEMLRKQKISRNYLIYESHQINE
jgi:hypothetical protein